MSKGAFTDVVAHLFLEKLRVYQTDLGDSFLRIPYIRLSYDII